MEWEKKFKTEVTWRGEGMCILFYRNGKLVTVGCPLERGWQMEELSPEELFIGAINACMITTFAYFAKKLGLDVRGIRCTAEGVLGRKGVKYTFKHIRVSFKLRVSSESEREKALKALKLAKKYCLLTKLVEGNVKVEVEGLVELKSKTGGDVKAGA